MSIIALEGVRFYAYHGYYEEEQVVGNEYILDVFVDTPTRTAADEDDLFDEESKDALTVNYEMLYQICRIEMREPAKLLETVVQRIVDRIDDQFDNVRGIRVKLRKCFPPLGGRVESSSVEVKTGVFGFPTVETLMVLKKFADDLEELEDEED